MTVHILELNDSEIGLFEGIEQRVSSPGFAVSDKQQVYLGEQAQQRARLYPRQLNHRYWSQINLDEIAHPLGNWHRHADIAHAHLQAVCEQGGHPQHLILAVPGSYQHDQLALILGICEQCSCKPVALVDAALAAALTVQFTTKKLLHLDLQLHQGIVTHFEHRDGKLQRTELTPLPGLGLQQFHDNWARYISAECIRQTRFDPVHTAQAEQALYNQLGHWLNALHDQQEITVQLQGHHIVLNRLHMLKAVEASYNRLLASLQVPHTTILLSHRVASLPGFNAQLSSSLTLANNAVAQGVMQAKQYIFAQSSTDYHPELAYFTALPQPQQTQHHKGPAHDNDTDHKQQSLSSANNTQITHILWRNKAYPLVFNQLNNNAEPAPFWIATHIPDDKTGLQLDYNDSAIYRCQVICRNGQLFIQIEAGSESYFTLNRARAAHREKILPLHCGDSIRVAGGWEELTFIQVETNNGG